MAHRYWRLWMQARSDSFGTWRAAVATFELRATVGGADMCPGQTFSSPASADPGYPVGNAFDGNASTIWMRGGWPQLTLHVEFASPVDVAEVRFVAAPAGGGSYPGSGSQNSPAATALEYSDDGIVWRRMAPVVDLSAIGDGGSATWQVQEPVFRIGGAAPGLRLSTPAIPTATVRLGDGAVRYDAVDGGPLRSAGTVAVDGTPTVPVSRRVRLFDQLSARLVRETWSDPTTGAFAFEGLRQAQYLVVSADHTALYDPVARDRVVPVP